MLIAVTVVLFTIHFTFNLSISLNRYPPAVTLYTYEYICCFNWTNHPPKGDLSNYAYQYIDMTIYGCTMENHICTTSIWSYHSATSKPKISDMGFIYELVIKCTVQSLHNKLQLKFYIFLTAKLFWIYLKFLHITWFNDLKYEYTQVSLTFPSSCLWLSNKGEATVSSRMSL